MRETGTLRVVVICGTLFLAAGVAGATTETEMPKGLWQAFSEARHAIEPIEGDAAAAFKAQSPGNDLVFRFGEQGLMVKPGVPGQDWELTMGLEAYGQEGALQPAGQAEVAAEGQRIEYRRRGVTEWYVNEPRGLEQGFTIERPEGYDPVRPVVLSLALGGGLMPTVTGDRRGVSFARPGGGQAFTYNGLAAFDAEGGELPAELALADGRLEIRVEVGGGSWPVTVDPVISTETKLQGAHDVATLYGRFGKSVSVDGNTAIVGEPFGDAVVADTGAAYVFVRYGGGWVFQAKIKAPNPLNGAEFGTSVSLSGDSVLIGARGDDGVVSRSGAAYVFVRSGTEWSFEDKLETAGGSANDFFGASVCLDGDTAVVGAHAADSSVVNTGAAYVYVRSDGQWSEEATLTALNPQETDIFGISVAISGDIAVVGDPFDDDGGSESGAAWVFSRSGGFWSAGQKLIPSIPSSNYRFGTSVSVSGDTALIGAFIAGSGGDGAAYVVVFSAGAWSLEETLTGSDVNNFGISVSVSGDTAVVGANATDVGGVVGAGAAFVYARILGAWSQQGSLVASDPSNSAYFGTSVSVSGDLAIVGAAYGDSTVATSGAAYAFVRSGTTWTEHAKLTAVVTVEADHFGDSVSISEDTALVGAPYDDDVASNSGSAYVFTRSGTTWSRQTKLVVPGLVTSAIFGSDVYLEGDTAVVGSPQGDGVVPNSGSTYVFFRSGDAWTLQAELQASDGSDGDLFGDSVSLSGDTVLVGARLDDDVETDSGSVYVFTRSGTAWSEQPKLTASASAKDDHFGSSVSVSGDTALVGASGADGLASDTGAAYVFGRSGGSWTQHEVLMAQDPQNSDAFGSAVSVFGDTALVGDLFGWAAGIQGGTAYVFIRTGIIWSQQAKLAASNADWGNEFGCDVSLSGDSVLVGSAYGKTMVGATGTAHVFVRAGAGWLESAMLAASDAAADDYFGTSVSLAGDTALVGVPWDDNGAFHNGSAYVNRFTCGFGGGVAPARWTMIGMPCDLGAFNTVEEVFGDNFVPAEYRYTWVVFRRDEATDRYVQMALNSPLEQGRGYWLWSSNWGVWDASGVLTPYKQSGLCLSPEGCYEVELTSPDLSSNHRWNLVGHPGNQTTNWSGVGVLVDSTLYTPGDAEAAGYISKTIHKYNGSAYEAFDDGTPGMEGTLESQEGVWVQVLGPSSGHSVILLIPDGIAPTPPGPPGGMGKAHEPAKGKPTRVDEWYVRVIAETQAEGLYDTRNVLGQLLDSEFGYDMRDLPELAPFSTPYLTIVFPHDDWGERSGDYTSDYHPPADKQTDEWLFQVRSDSPWRDVRLAWENVRMFDSTVSHDNGRRQWTTSRDKSGESLMAKMWLEDLDTGEMVKVAEDGVAQDYRFNMDGETVRSFRWVLRGRGNHLPPPELPEKRDPAPTADTLGLPANGIGTPPRPGRGN